MVNDRRLAALVGNYPAGTVDSPGPGVPLASRACALAGSRNELKETYRRVSLPVLSRAVAGVLVRAMTSRSWWRLATPSLG